MFSLEELEKATSEVFLAHNVHFSLKFDADLGNWVFAVTGQWVTVDSKKEEAIKKALKRSGYLQEVAAKLS
jgi:hypothetical protein